MTAISRVLLVIAGATLIVVAMSLTGPAGFVAGFFGGAMVTTGFLWW